MSTLGRGDEPALAEDGLDVGTGDADLPTIGTSEDVVDLRPKKESKPPLDFFFVSSGTCTSALGDSTIFHPAGAKSSLVMLGFAFTEASHEVNPFDDK